MMPWNYKLRKRELQEKINHLIYMDYIKIFAKNESELEIIPTIIIYSQNIWMDFAIKMCHDKKKSEIETIGRIKRPNQ